MLRQTVTYKVDAMNVLRALLGLSLMMMLAGCGDDMNRSAELEYRFDVLDRFEQSSDQFQMGEEIRLHLTASNASAEVKTLYFTDGQETEFELYSGDGVLLWRWSDDQVFLAALHEREVSPQSELTAEVVICPAETGEGEVPVCPPFQQGKHTLKAWFLGTGVELEQQVSIN